MNLLVDAIGAIIFPKDTFSEMTKAGGQIEWYNAIRFTTWPRINNRTHREFLIVDGTSDLLEAQDGLTTGTRVREKINRDGATRWCV